MAKVGFLGLGIMGSRMAANLIRGGFDVHVWNRNRTKCAPLVELGAKLADYPMDVTAECDVTFAMVSDPAAAKSICFGPGGVLAGIGEGRGYVDMSTVDAGTSQEIEAAITAVGGRFLEAPVSGTKKPAEDGTLIILAAGDQSLYHEVIPHFEKMGKLYPYLGKTGQGTNMKLVINMIMGGMISIFSEGLSLAQKSSIDSQKMLEILSAGALASPLFSGKGPMILEDDFSTSFPLKHMQKDLRLAIDLGDKLGQPLPNAATVNETFKRASHMGLSDEDFTAVFKAIK